MGIYNVEVEGHYWAVIEVDASSPEEAEEFSIRAFEEDYKVVANQGFESWDRTSIVAVFVENM
jgi:hypothetical protein